MCVCIYVYSVFTYINIPMYVCTNMYVCIYTCVCGLLKRTQPGRKDSSSIHCLYSHSHKTHIQAYTHQKKSPHTTHIHMHASTHSWVNVPINVFCREYFLLSRRFGQQFFCFFILEGRKDDFVYDRYMALRMYVCVCLCVFVHCMYCKLC